MEQSNILIQQCSQLQRELMKKDRRIDELEHELRGLQVKIELALQMPSKNEKITAFHSIVSEMNRWRI